ncbi:MAG: VWA domain-containing protein [Chromatiaceae bacterium]|nr:VWA domain-containing protein [Chromatiaceae bacterium]MCP5408243.1 VWA domain-containing protein [Chromatiaceae bacterium]MCP5442057.1 VWA domain-containing protein [Chromatiaceae bacterium]
MSLNETDLRGYRRRLTCNFEQIDQVFSDCITEATAILSPNGVKDYLDGASLVCMVGRGVEPVLCYLEEMPDVARKLGEETLTLVAQTVWKISRSPNGKAIPVFLQTLAEASRRLGSRELLQRYCAKVLEIMERTSSSIHGNQSATIPSPSLVELLARVPGLLRELSFEGLNNWIEYGLKHYLKHPERQRDYFRLQSADSRAILQRERHGTLYADHERKLDLYMKALWHRNEMFVPYSNAFDQLRKPVPYYDDRGIRVPDVYDDKARISGINRYRALLAHVAAHKRWTKPIIADNYSPFQRVAIEMFEDSRVEHLAMQSYPGLRRLWTALHPAPGEEECDPDKESCIRHRLAMLSYALLCPDHNYRNADLLEFVARFHQLMQRDGHTTKEVADLAISYIARTRRQSDLSANIYFADTEVSYRDDNRHMWRFIEEGDEEEMFEEERKVEQEDSDRLPPRHYPEWEYKSKTYRPDWVSLYESLHPSGDAAIIDRLLTKHQALVKQLKQLLDLLKPQQYVRVRYQEEGSELDLDVAIRSLIDLKGGAQPDPRINMSHRHDGRDIAVMLLLDLSESLNHVPDGCNQTILELSQEAVALLGFAIEHLGDEFAIAGFSSNTRHEVRYQHIKGYSEHWDDRVKARLAAMQAGYSTRMGAAIRHAAHYLEARKADKKLLLILTDGEPHDIDEQDERLLIEDTRKAVLELDRQGIYSFCVNLDPQADEYVQDIFGQRFTVIDRVERLPRKLPELFLSLTR